MPEIHLTDTFIKKIRQAASEIKNDDDVLEISDMPSYFVTYTKKIVPSGGDIITEIKTEESNQTIVVFYYDENATKP